MKKIKLTSLKIETFVTSLEQDQQQTIAGGSAIETGYSPCQENATLLCNAEPTRVGKGYEQTEGWIKT